MKDLRYVSIDQEDGVFGRPKKLIPNTDFAKKALGICGRKFYQPGEKSRWLKIEKAMLPLSAGLESIYPTEWVEQILEWAKKKNKYRIVIVFPNMLNAIENEDLKNDFIAYWHKQHPKIEGDVLEQSFDTIDPISFDWTKLEGYGH